MTTHRFELHGDIGGHGWIAYPARILHRTERRLSRRRNRRTPPAGSGRATEASTAPAQVHEPGPARVVYWIGDERETTQGDW